jgi:chorismate mutase
MDPRLDLDKVIRPELEQMEDNIIFGLLERTPYKHNQNIYQIGGLDILDQTPAPTRGWMANAPAGIMMSSFLDYMLEETEKVHASAGRYQHPLEHPFTKGSLLPKPIVERAVEESPAQNSEINFNKRIKNTYLNSLLQICETGDDGHYGSTALCDIKLLQDLSKRIHYGVYVAESKFQESPEEYSELIMHADEGGIMKLLTEPKVEEKILKRLTAKANRYGIPSEFLVDFYRDKIIPMTREVEVDYFFKRKLD